MASGHVNRTQRPNTWLHRPSLRREESPCQLGAVHTWPLAPQYWFFFFCDKNVRNVGHPRNCRLAASKQRFVSSTNNRVRHVNTLSPAPTVI